MHLRAHTHTHWRNFDNEWETENENEEEEKGKNVFRWFENRVFDLISEDKTQPKLKRKQHTACVYKMWWSRAKISIKNAATHQQQYEASNMKITIIRMALRGKHCKSAPLLLLTRATLEQPYSEVNVRRISERNKNRLIKFIIIYSRVHSVKPEQNKRMRQQSRAHSPSPPFKKRIISKNNQRNAAEENRVKWKCMRTNRLLHTHTGANQVKWI